MNKNILAYALPILTILVLIICLIVFGGNKLVGLVALDPQITGYVQINSLGNLPSECRVFVKFYKNNVNVEEINLSYKEFLSKSRVEKDALEEIYFLDLSKIVDIRIDADKVISEVWCGENFVAESETKL